MRFAENTQHDTSKVLPLPRKMTSEVSKVLRLPWKMQRIFWKRRKSIVPATQNHVWHVLKDGEMSRSATPAMQNDITACFETFNEERGLAASPIDTATAPQRPATGDETCWSIKRSISRETSLHRSFKIDVFLRFFLRTDLKIDISCKASVDFFITCRKMPRLPRNLHLVTTSRSADNAIRRKHATRHV